MTFWPVARLDQVPDGGCLQVEAGGELVGLYRVGSDIYALGDVCTHQEAYLTEGEFDPDELEVECPLHGSRFNVATGAVRILPALKPEPTFEVKVEGDEVLVGPRREKGQ
ncbi:MAG TPA: non-heme iron oxygenase ferredoxin subunit [Actinomycetota bacterium]|nr:non-heme iron oxygenase ferredoxin subunit [Actinomycetota bacterium]